HTPCPDSVVLVSTLRHTPSFTLFPYTTLFQSKIEGADQQFRGMQPSQALPGQLAKLAVVDLGRGGGHAPQYAYCLHVVRSLAGRSEEHTSELQSRENLVCRLLLENQNSLSRSS